MLALLGNFDFTELLVIAAGALMVFGKRLPEVAMRAAAHLVRLRRSVQQMWRQSGLDEELRKVRREVEREMVDLSVSKELTQPLPGRRTPATRTKQGTLDHGIDPAGIEADYQKRRTSGSPPQAAAESVPGDEGNASQAPGGGASPSPFEPLARDRERAAAQVGPDPEPGPPVPGEAGQRPSAPDDSAPPAGEEPGTSDPDGRDPSDRESA